jgi:hypothetical protein
MEKLSQSIDMAAVFCVIDMAAPLSLTEPLPEVITPLVGRACKAKLAELSISKVILQEAIAKCWAVKRALFLKEFIWSFYG